MRRAIVLCALVLTALLIAVSAPIAAADGPVYELRVYTAAEGKMDELHARFRDHTMKIFEKHGMRVVGFWSPVDEAEAVQKLYYILEFPDVATKDQAWKNFGSDPEWRKVAEESQKNGRLLTGVESVMLQSTDYAPKQ